ncbi:NTP transferase domain-containing protein [Sphingobacterium cellulitidis]|uniref:NTP transferase domain-containing protein n=1 Tax=Sphingobacterium cellulitidis TaxID=1768011 RepID=UPI000B93C7F9|nr:molybdenum cofactor guanylyltransferase [Sphingobacterium cellulitidis]
MISKEQNNVPEIYGLVLAGGKSRRMGKPKDLMDWHGKEQRYFAADLLSEFCEQVFISCREDQLEDFDSHYQSLTDSFLNMGPFGGILSALHAHRNKAWLVVACDLPLLDRETLNKLVENRDSDKIATTYKSPFDSLPEPLISIWEPKSFGSLLNSLEKGITCPRKVLINGDILILDPESPDALMNVNSPEDAQKAQQVLKNEGKK